MTLPMILYALCISALLCNVRLCWIQFKSKSGGTPVLAMACVCLTLIAFMTLVPAVMYTLMVPDGHPAPLNIDPMGTFP